MKVLLFLREHSFKNKTSNEEARLQFYASPSFDACMLVGIQVNQPTS